MNIAVEYEAFREQWLSDVRSGKPSTTELGRRFSCKLLTHWLDIDDTSDDLVYCDGAGDGGIDLAYLHRSEGQEPEGDGKEGDVWYLVQSKYGTAFSGTNTVLEEAKKVIDTLDGKRQRLASLAEGLLARLTMFRERASELDRIILVFATVDPLTDDEKRTLKQVRDMGRGTLGPMFDVESISIDTIYRRAVEEVNEPKIRVSMKAKLSQSGANLMVGAVSLLDLYEFLKAYRAKSGDIDELYEKNVRRFLGSRGKVNKAMLGTLKDTPELFGLYNNGITIVVTDFAGDGNGSVELTDPYVVNGCQTTRTIWEVCHQRLESGGSGTSANYEKWRGNAASGVVVTKIVKVGDGDSLLNDITKYTNSQNAIREKDFIALKSDFRGWARQMAEKYDIFLEVQRGGWESQLARQKQSPSAHQFKSSANAFDLLRVYGAGWLVEAGAAFGSGKAFVPSGTIFKRIINNEGVDEPFGVEDLYAAYRLHIKTLGGTGEYEFGRKAKSSRRQTRYLFFMVVLDLLKDILVRQSKGSGPKDLTRALLKLFESQNESALRVLLDTALEVVDEYMTPGQEDSVYEEPAFKNTFNNDLGGYLKSEQMGKSESSSPRLRSLLQSYKRTMNRKSGRDPSPRDTIIAALGL
ncbi:MAG TPA: AIPR family protein [Polyangium sp.]|nr:AIPR family protein [Polyangium sp.]